MKADPVASEVIDIITDIVRAEAGRFGISAVRVAPGFDHDGDPILLIDADYDAGGQPFDPKVVAGLAPRLREQLWPLGEERLPYVRHHFRDDQRILGFP